MLNIGQMQKTGSHLDITLAAKCTGRTQYHDAADTTQRQPPPTRTPPQPTSGKRSHSLDQHGVLLLVVVEAEAVAGAERYHLPLRVQREGGDHGGRLALDQGEGLEPGREQHRLLPHVQPRVALTGEGGGAGGESEGLCLAERLGNVGPLGKLG